MLNILFSTKRLIAPRIKWTVLEEVITDTIVWKQTSFGAYSFTGLRLWKLYKTLSPTNKTK